VTTKPANSADTRRRAGFRRGGLSMRSCFNDLCL